MGKMALPSISCILMLQLLLQILKADAKFPAVIVFGDSTVDSGNNNHIPALLKSNFKPYGRDFDGGRPTGRFSNGRIPPDFVSQALGLQNTIPAYLDSSYSIENFTSGVCFASAGTGYYNVTSAVLNVMPLSKELELYKQYQGRLRAHLGKQNAEEVLSKALYIISIGTNDFVENYYLLPQTSLKFSIEEYQNFLASIARNFITQLYKLGARRISLTGLPPMGCLPLERALNAASGGGCIEKYNKVALEFNQKSVAMVDALKTELSGLQLVLFNPYSVLYDIIQKPHSHGFEESAIACCGTGRFELGYTCIHENPFTCPDANKYVFWDSFHPTEKTNRILANYAIKTYLTEFH